MIKTGIVSVTFRELDVDQVIELVKNASLSGIEWGGDIHVPHGDIDKAEIVRKKTEEAGLEIAGYGSYYRLGCENEVEFEEVLNTAEALGAPVIRVWAGNRGTNKADQDWWNKIIAESERIAVMAQKKGIDIAYEYHKNSLTDSSESTLNLLKNVGKNNLSTYWQPPVETDFEENIEGLKKVLSEIYNVHVHYWQNGERLALRQGKESWSGYLEEISKIPGKRFALLEFVKNGTIEQFKEDALVLNDLVKKFNS